MSRPSIALPAGGLTLASERPAAASTAGVDRYAWVDFAKGLCIVLVVGLWVLREMPQGYGGWLYYLTNFAKPFRMPDFFLLSGLFLSRVIDRPWRSYLDTKVVHYGYFLVLWSLILIGVQWLTGTAPASFGDAAAELLARMNKPPAMLWFILMLPIYFVSARLLRAVPVPVVLGGAILLAVFPVHTGINAIDWFGEYFVYFYCGHALAERIFSLADLAARRPRATAALLAAWAVVNALAIKAGAINSDLAMLVLGFTGICAVVAGSSLLSGLRAARVLRYLGRNSIVVYLGFFLPMLAIFWLSPRIGLAAWPNLQAAVAIGGSIGAAIGLAALTRGTRMDFLFRRPAWAQLVADPRGARPRDNGRAPVQAT